MNFRKYKILAGAVALLLLTLMFVIGVHADNDLPWVPIPTDQKPTSIKISSNPIKTLYLVGEDLDVSGARLELTYESGQKLPDVVKTEWCSGFDSKKVGKKTVTVTYPETSCTATFTVEVVTEDSLKIVTPSKLVYYVGDIEDRQGLAVSVVYSNGKTALLESGFTVTGFSSNTIGEKTVTVKYKDLTASYKINVVEPALLMIKIDKVPNKVSYYIGEVLDISGIKVSAIYENGVVTDVSSKVLAEGDIKSAGKKKITVIYTERDFIKTAEFEVTVTDVQIKNIKFSSYPKKTVYAEREAFDPTGIAIQVTYNNGKSETVTDNILYTGFDTDTIGKKTVTLHYGGYQLNFEVEVVVASSHVHKETEFTRTKAPTCTEPGEETTTCTVCFETVSRRSVPATGHGAESMPVQTKAPTCTEAGATSTYCMICGGVVTVSDIFPLGHTEGEMNIILSPTCTENGTSKSFCTVCSDEVTVLTIDPLGHSFGLWQMTLEPTGEQEGKEERACTVCSFVETRTVPKLEKILSVGDFSAQLNSSASYFPYSSQFGAEKVTDKLTAEEIALLIPESEREKYRILDVFDFGFTNVLGERFLPKGDITYTVNYELPYGEYQSFMIFDTDYGIYTPATSSEAFSFTVERIGRFILVGELLPDQTDPETQDPTDTSDELSSQEGTSGINVSVPPVKGTSAVIMALIIIAVILLVIIAALVYTYAFKQDY
ncbi:MAG: bacterial Ig-like domain-containing protein [Clostridia bacterium]|nr:bacterial Ig-like domain-containing protein [Clostridia bacterium]